MNTTDVNAELLEALVNLLAEVNSGKIHRFTCEKAEAAIQKATGRSHHREQHKKAKGEL